MLNKRQRKTRARVLNGQGDCFRSLHRSGELNLACQADRAASVDPAIFSASEPFPVHAVAARRLRVMAGLPPTKPMTGSCHTPLRTRQSYHLFAVLFLLGEATARGVRHSLTGCEPSRSNLRPARWSSPRAVSCSVFWGVCSGQARLAAFSEAD